MSSTLLITGRETDHGRDVLATHARRLADRGVVGQVEVLLYEDDPARELRPALDEVGTETVYAMPTSFAHTGATTNGVPAALSRVAGEVRYCEPLGRSPALTDVLAERAREAAPGDSDVSLVLAGFGDSSRPFHEQASEYHAARLREREGLAEVHACYLVQNPAVECARYNIDGPGVAVPLFLADCPATTTAIPEKLELDRGGIAYGDPLGTHPRVTDAIAGEVERQRALAGRADAEPSAPPEADLVAADGGRANDE